LVCNIAGNVWTATTHIITVVVGAGVLALAWAMAQLGWIAGIASILTFASISIFTYSLVADCYRFPDPITGKRNYTYMQAVKSYLGILFYSCIHMIKPLNFDTCTLLNIWDIFYHETMYYSMRKMSSRALQWWIQKMKEIIVTTKF